MSIRPPDLAAIRAACADGAPILVSTHVHPDPDAVGSVLAAREMLLQLGGRPRIVLENGFAPRIRWLPDSALAENVASQNPDARFERAFIVDCGSRSRIGEVERFLSPTAMIFNIDHHVSNDNFGGVNVVDTAACATGELLYDICDGLQLRITPALATNLLAGMLTDTGRFRYSNTTPACLRACARLLEAGADITAVTNALYFDLPARDLQSMSKIYGSLELFADGKISTMFVPAANLVEDPDSIVDLGLSIRGVEVAVLLSEAEAKIRVSLRSKHFVNVSRIAESFGGGGHERAAGFRMQGTLPSVRDRILPTLLAAVNQVPRPGSVAV
ncbi:bifunctional oligoribonuclease/PAP phosphatase NrnA [candidate division KSB1 bacterium]|nr:bifunctional oligoribonuclease/PAP phosphatase NrnA [candidate division KSB1 bacterium]